MINEQVINEVLAKKLKITALDSETASAYKAADEFLLKKSGEKPVWFDDFLESNKRKLVETICRATAAGSGIASLAGYNEGYFNEIIQNANDLHAGDYVKVITHIEGAQYIVECVYADEGFKLSNIYGFLNREMSDKSADDGQTGKFGVGIKSFFNFVDSLVIKSNVIFDFRIKRNGEDVDVSGTVKMNDSWDGATTALTFAFGEKIVSDNASGFNIEKLAQLICYLNGKRQDNPLRYLVNGENKELVFDARSLIFMSVVNAFSRKKGTPVIKKISFGGLRHRVDVSCNLIDEEKRIKLDDAEWCIGEYDLAVNVDGYQHFDNTYLSMAQTDITFAYPLHKELRENNRFYSTYYIKTDIQNRLLPMGVLINSKFANIHRNDLGDSEESIDRAYSVICKRFGKLYELFCSEQIEECGTLAISISDVFYSLLDRYIDYDRNIYTESPLNTEGLDTKYLPKIITGENKSYVVKHDETEKYEIAAYAEGNIEEELKSLYLSSVEKGDVYDLDYLTNSDKVILGVQRLFIKLSQHDDIDDALTINYEIIEDVVNYFKNVASFLGYRISGAKTNNVADAYIDRWLISLRDELGKYFNAQYFLKLVGRYKLNPAVEFDGSIKSQNLSFKDYLFNDYLDEQDGILSKLQTEQFKDKYSGLKQQLLRKRLVDDGNKDNRYEIRCICPKGRSVGNWNGTYDYYSISYDEVSSYQVDNPLLIVERLATDDRFYDCVRMSGSRLLLFEKFARVLQQREYTFANYCLVKQQIIDLSCVRRLVTSNFTDFVRSIDYRRKIKNERVRDAIRLKCEAEFLTTQELVNSILPMLVADAPIGKKRLLDEFDSGDVCIKNISENTNNESPEENRKFIENITGYQIHFYKFDSNSRRKTLAYCCNDGFFLRTDASKQFAQIAETDFQEQELYIFYDNFSEDIQSAIPIVLEQIGIGKKALEILKGYIHNGNNTKSLSYISRMRNIAKVKRKLVLDWADISGEDLEVIYDNEVLYRLLTARGSYDVFCPICADVPLEAFDYDENDKRKHSRRLVILENENLDTKDEIPYVITVACSYCFEKLKNSLTSSEFDGRHLILTTQIAHGQFEKAKSKHQIELSPLNVEIMKKFKMV